MIPVLLAGFGWLKAALSAVLGFAAKYPWQAACIALAVIAALFWRGEHKALSQRNEARAQIVAIQKAQKDASALALAQHNADEAHYKELAANADTRHSAEVAQADAATSAFIAAHRMRSHAQGAAGDTTPQAEGGDPDVPTDTPSDTIVAVSAGDVKVCAADYSYAKAAYDWAASLGK